MEFNENLIVTCVNQFKMYFFFLIMDFIDVKLYKF